MTRISLKEAYDNRDVVAQLVADRQDIDEIKQVLAELPDPDLTNVVLKTGDQTIDGEKTFTDVIHADGGLDLANMGPLTVNGDLEVNGDIIQNGSAYETHAEQVFSANDYIVTRDGAVGSLPAGAYSGIQVKKYNGVDDCRLVVDNTGTARVGDINDEQPLMTRDESVDMSNGALLKWDGVHGKAVSSPMDATPTAGSVNAVTSDGIKSAIDGAVSGMGSTKVTGSGNIGSDLKPIKIVNGQAVAVANDLQTKLSVSGVSYGTMATGITGSVSWVKYGQIVFLSVGAIYGLNANQNDQVVASGLPASAYGNQNFNFSDPSGITHSLFYVTTGGELRANTNATASFYGNAVYIATS